MQRILRTSAVFSRRILSAAAGGVLFFGADPAVPMCLYMSDLHDPPHHWMMPVCTAVCCTDIRKHRRRMSLTSALLCAAADSSRRFLLQSGERPAPNHCLSHMRLPCMWWQVPCPVANAYCTKGPLHHVAAMYCFWILWRCGPHLPAGSGPWQLLAST